MSSVAVLNPDLGSFVRRGSGSSQPAASAMAQLRIVWDQTKHDPSVLALHPTKRRLDALRQLDADWDGFGSEKPQADAINRTLSTLPALFTDAEMLGGWELPHVAANENGEITLEWWEGTRKLTLFVRADRIEYLRTWGENIENEMDDGTLEDGDFADLWAWLRN